MIGHYFVRYGSDSVNSKELGEYDSKKLVNEAEVTFCTDYIFESEVYVDDSYSIFGVDSINGNHTALMSSIIRGAFSETTPAASAVKIFNGSRFGTIGLSNSMASVKGRVFFAVKGKRPALTYMLINILRDTLFIPSKVMDSLVKKGASYPSIIAAIHLYTRALGADANNCKWEYTSLGENLSLTNIEYDTDEGIQTNFTRKCYPQLGYLDAGIYIPDRLGHGGKRILLDQFACPGQKLKVNVKDLNDYFTSSKFSNSFGRIIKENYGS